MSGLRSSGCGMPFGVGRAMLRAGPVTQASNLHTYVQRHSVVTRPRKRLLVTVKPTRTHSNKNAVSADEDRI